MFNKIINNNFKKFNLILVFHLIFCYCSLAKFMYFYIWSHKLDYIPILAANKLFNIGNIDRMYRFLTFVGGNPPC